MALLQLPFVKAHGLGNDFLLVRAEEVARVPPERLARVICDRHSGVGADGLVTLGPSGEADAAFRIYNADGSEAGLSGNALRCAAAWLLAEKGERARVTLETRGGLREQFFVWRKSSAWIFRAEIGKPVFSAGEIPFRPPRPPVEPIVNFPLPVGDTTVRVTVLSMGNPQCILLSDDSVVDWLALGAEIESHPFFPERTNVGFVRVLGDDRIEARFYERGVGHTLASGTGSCACAVAAHLARRTGRRLTVAVERGDMEICWREDGMVELTGPAEITCEGTFLCDL